MAGVSFKINQHRSGTRSFFNIMYLSVLLTLHKNAKSIFIDLTTITGYGKSFV